MIKGSEVSSLDRMARMVLFTTRDISAPAHCHDFIELLQELYGVTDMVVHLEGTPEHVAKKSLRQCSRAEIEDAYSEGVFLVTDRDEKRLRASITWHRLCGGEAKSFLKTQGYKQNEIMLKTLAADVSDAGFKRQLVSFCKKAAHRYSANLLLVADLSVQLGGYYRHRGLEVGLCDLYWITVLGKPYLEIIGKQRILKCPWHIAEELSADMLYFQLTGELNECFNRLGQEQIVALRKCVGDEYFARMQDEDRSSSGQMSVLGFVKWALAEKRSFFDRTRDAKVRPRFDWSDIYGIKEQEE